MAQSKSSPTKASAKKAAKRTSRGEQTADEIAEAARDLQREVTRAVRGELKHLGKLFDTLQRDVSTAIKRIESAVDQDGIRPKGARSKKGTPARPAKKSSSPSKRPVRR